MRKMITIFVIGLLALGLVACQETTDVSVEFTSVEVELTQVIFTLVLTDPNEEVNSLTVEVFKGNERVRTLNVNDAEGLEGITFTSLTTETLYRIEVSASIGRDIISVGTYEFTTLSAALVTIETTEQFLNMKNNRSGNYVLGNDLDFEGVTFVTPFSSSFSGTFDGQGHTISNITFDSISTYTGIFGFVSTGTIQNLVFDNITIGTEAEPLVMQTSARIGIISGYVAGSNALIENITIKNSRIYVEIASTIHMYVGGAVGEQRGKLEDITLENVDVSLTSKSYGRVKLGGVVGYLYEEATLKRIASDVNVTFALDAANTRDRDFSIFVGGVIGDNLGKISPRAVDSIYSTGDVIISQLDFNTLETSTKGFYIVYVGGLVGRSLSNVYQGFYDGNLSVTHVKGDHDDVASKTFSIGGLVGFYGANESLQYLIRVGAGNQINVDVADDVNLRAKQTVGQNARQATLTVGVVGTQHLMINGNDETMTDNPTVINDIQSFYITDWIKERFPN
ncbi:MAG: hypothetical protein ACNA7K_05890 [Acholeplasmataceae bacterium]